jgi:DNA polymerase-3 subunit gamma/tau
LDQARLEAHFADICTKESVSAEPEALRLIARAADGSVRDGLSLLDQAIALGGGESVGAAEVSEMLGLADRTRIFDLLESVLRGDAAAALGLLEDLYQVGADPAVILQDLLELIHLVTRAKLVPESLNDQPEAEQTRGEALAEALKVPDLTRCWQILLKGLDEVHAAPHRRQAAEMAIIRLLHASRLPTPADLVREIKGGSGDGRSAASSGGPAKQERAISTNRSHPVQSAEMRPDPVRMTASGVAEGALTAPAARVAAERAPAMEPETTMETLPASVAEGPADFEAIVRRAEEMRSVVLANHLRRDFHLVRFEPGRIEFRPGGGAPPSLAQDLTRFLREWTGQRWMVTVSQADGEETLQERRARLDAEKRARVLDHPLVRAALETFPDARVRAVREKIGTGEPKRDVGTAANGESEEWE